MDNVIGWRELLSLAITRGARLLLTISFGMIIFGSSSYSWLPSFIKSSCFFYLILFVGTFFIIWYLPGSTGYLATTAALTTEDDLLFFGGL